VRILFFKHFDRAANAGNRERPLPPLPPSDETFRGAETWASRVREGAKVMGAPSALGGFQKLRLRLHHGESRGSEPGVSDGSL